MKTINKVKELAYTGSWIMNSQFVRHCSILVAGGVVAVKIADEYFDGLQLPVGVQIAIEVTAYFTGLLIGKTVADCADVLLEKKDERNEELYWDRIRSLQ